MVWHGMGDWKERSHRDSSLGGSTERRRMAGTEALIAAACTANVLLLLQRAEELSSRALHPAAASWGFQAAKGRQLSPMAAPCRARDIQGCPRVVCGIEYCEPRRGYTRVVPITQGKVGANILLLTARRTRSKMCV